MTLVVRKRKRAKAEQIIEWWKPKKEVCCENFRNRLRQALGDWIITARVTRETCRDMFGVSAGQRRDGKETWWWNEVQKYRRL